jgi:hypothetical protein
VLTTEPGLIQECIVEEVDIPFIEAVNGNPVQRNDDKKDQGGYEVASYHQHATESAVNLKTIFHMPIKITR